MILLYSGACSPDTPQINPEKSLGGFASSTTVANGRIGNIFSSISKNTVLKNKKECRLIVLKNTTGSTVNTIKIYSDVTGGSIKLKLAAVAPATNSAGQKVFEEIFDGQTIPQQATLDYHELVGNAIAVSTLAAGDMIGIWIYREMDLTKFPGYTPVIPPLTCSEIAANIPNSAAEKEEGVNLIVSYT